MPTNGRFYVPRDQTNPADTAELVLLAHAPADGLAELLTDLNDRLSAEGSGWRLAVEPGDGTRSRVVPILVSYQRDGADQRASGAASLVNLLTRSGLNASGDPVLVGSPAYKPHALSRDDFGRVPVTVLAAGAAARRPLAELPGGRRPVVALLDTAVRPHEWLGRPCADPAEDAFWTDARDLGWDPGRRLPVPGPLPVPPEPLGRELGDQEGHGTFCAGLVRQVAPDVRVLAVQVMSDGGRLYGDHVLNAAGWLADDAGLGQGDVVCLPFGFEPIWPTDASYLRWLGDILGELGDRGILVVAAAGNDGGSDPVYPAAFTAAANPPGTRLVSVGALNPNRRTRAEFSNHGDWVRVWEVGVSVVSAFPAVNGAGNPELSELSPGGGRESADPDDFTGGFARWSGTSFAAAIYAGMRAQERTGVPVDAVSGSGTAC